MIVDVPRVLLADDEETFRRSTAKLLEQEGYRCDCAQDSEEAGRMLTPEHDALIADIRMPGNMQLEFLQDVRARFPSLPVVVITGYPSVQTAVEALRLSCADYLLKPVDWPELHRAVDHAMKKAGFLRMTAAVREEACRVEASLDWLQEIMPELGSGEKEQKLGWPREKFLAQSFAQMATLSSQIRALMASQRQGVVGESTDVCRTMECPRLTAYREALESTVEVLEKTKFTFRSKNLGLLRKKIEQLLREDA